MTHLDLILPTCGLLIIVCLLLKTRELLNDMVAGLESARGALQVTVSIMAILIVLVGAAALMYAAFWLTVALAYHLFTS